jgi:hypothetical protein
LIWRGHAGFKLHVGERRPAWTTRPYSEDIRERALAWADGVHSCRVTKWNNRGERPEAFRPARSEATRRRFCLAHTPTGCAFARGHSPCASWRGSWQRVESRRTVGRRGPSFTMRVGFQKNDSASRADRPDIARKRTRWKAYQSGFDASRPPAI